MVKLTLEDCWTYNLVKCNEFRQPSAEYRLTPREKRCIQLILAHSNKIKKLLPDSKSNITDEQIMKIAKIDEKELQRLKEA